MTPAELGCRIGDVGRHLALSFVLDRVQSQVDRSLDARQDPFTLPFGNGALAAVPPRVKESVITAANQWLEHRASFFALSNAALGDSINWHRDYSSGVTAPLKYSGLINYRNAAAVGDVKYIWELNRLQQLVLLALAMAWSGNPAYENEVERQTLSWQAQNPFMKGLNWKSPLEAGLRLISWAYVAFVLGRTSRQNAFSQSLLETIYQHQYFIRQFHSKHSSANNHLVGEMAGLYVGAVFWPWFRESRHWRAFAQEKLIQEMFRQVEGDGVGKERATEYQIFVIELFLLTAALGHLVGDPFPADYWRRLTLMIRFLNAIRNRAGDLPSFGDGDSGQAVWLPEGIPARVDSLVWVGQSGEEEGRDSGLRCKLLSWGQPRRQLPIAPWAPSAGDLELFPDGGYCVLASHRGREDEIMAVFDAGPLGLPPLNAHGHADALSFWFSYGGREFLIDPGTYCYHRSARWRDYFRGTAAHNTVRIDKEDQSVPAGTFLWRRAALCRLERVENTDAFVDARGSHDGYHRLADPVGHARSLRLYKRSRTLRVTDDFKCGKAHRIEMLFHFSESCQVRRAGANCIEAANGGRRIAARFDPRLELELYRAAEEPIFGWVSRTFGVKEPSSTLVARANIAGAARFVTEISGL